MKKVLIGFLTLLVFLVLHCILPEDPSQNPSNASATFTTVNGDEPMNLNEVIAGETVVIGYSLFLPAFIDSVQITILTPKQDVETTYVFKAPWESEDNSVPVIFPFAGTKTFLLTSFSSDGTVKSANLTFIVAYQPGNRPPVWSPDTVELTSQKGFSERRSLLPYSKDPDGNPISFEIIPQNDQFNIQDSFVTAGVLLEPGLYPIQVIVSDAELQDTGTIIWNIFVPQSEHAVLQDDRAETAVDSRVTIDVLSNDSSTSGIMILSSVTQPDNGITAINNNKVIYIPDSGFSGIDTFKYTVNSMDTGSVTVNVINRAPQWDSVSIEVNMEDTGKYLLSLATICSDSDGDPVSFLLLSDALPGDTILESTYEFIPTASVIGGHSVQIIASDPHGAKDTLLINFTVTVSSTSDITPPTMKLSNPQTDSTSVNASSATVSIEVTDLSGIASVTASFGATDLQVSTTNSVYSATVTNLVANHFSTARFIATDASSNGNKETLFVTVKYDPTMSDATGPVFKQISGPASGAIITDPLVTIVDSIIDPSGIDSVFWRLNNGPVKPLTAVSGKPDCFSLTDSVKQEHFDTIVVTAVDKSTGHNRSVQTIVLNYIIPPVVSVPPASQTVCAGTVATFLVTASGTAPLYYQWRKGVGTEVSDIPGANDASYGFTPGATDNGTIFSCVVSNGSKIDAVSEPGTLTVNSASTKPTATTTPATICSGESSVLSVSAGTLGTGAAWRWYTNKSSASALSSLTVSPTSGSWYYVKGTGGSCGDSPWDSVYVTVNTPSTAPSGINASTSTVCSGSQVTLTQTNGVLGTGATWQWFTNAACTQPAAGIKNTDGSEITVTPSSNTTYYLQAVGTCNTTTAVSKPVTVSYPSTPPSGINSASTSVCPGGSLTLTVSGGSLGTGATWKWYTNAACTQAAVGTPNSDGSQFTVAPAAQTTYYVHAKGSCNTTPAASKTISVSTPPNVGSLSDQDVCVPGGSASFSISASGDTPFSYEWRKSDGSLLGTSSFQSVSTNQVGTTSLYCIVTDVNGCSSQSNTVKVTVHQPTVFTRQPRENNGGYYVTQCVDTVNATGEGTLSYQWQYRYPDNGIWETMATGNTLSIIPSDAFAAYSSNWGVGGTIYIPVRVRITNSFGCETFSNTVNFAIMTSI